MIAHSEKFMNVSDMQVPDEDDRHDDSQQNGQSKQQDRERANLDARFPLANKTGKERIWINPVTSKIEFQLLDTDTDAQLHEECVISVRKEAEFASRVLQERCPVDEFQEVIKAAQKTVITPQVPR